MEMLYLIIEKMDANCVSVIHQVRLNSKMEESLLAISL